MDNKIGFRGRPPNRQRTDGDTWRSRREALGLSLPQFVNLLQLFGDISPTTVKNIESGIGASPQKLAQCEAVLTELEALSPGGAPVPLMPGKWGCDLYNVFRTMAEGAVPLRHKSVQAATNTLLERLNAGHMVARGYGGFTLQPWVWDCVNGPQIYRDHAASSGRQRKPSPVTISIAGDSPITLATALSLQRFQQTYDLPFFLRVSIHDGNGPSQVQEIIDSENPPEFAVLGTSFAMSIADADCNRRCLSEKNRMKNFRLLLPLNEVETQILARDPDDVSAIHLPPGGFGEFAYHCPSQSICEGWADKRRLLLPNTDPLTIGRSLSANEAVACYGAVASQLRSEVGLRRFPALGLQSLEGLYVNSSYCAPDRRARSHQEHQPIVQCFAAAFLSEYQWCVTHPYEACFRLFLYKDFTNTLRRILV